MDYNIAEPSLQVDSAQNLDKDEHRLGKQDLFIRFGVNYAISANQDQQASGNASNESQDLVIKAETYVNEEPRVSKLRVVRIEKNDTKLGEFRMDELGLGNDLSLTLSCCNASKCKASKVLCPYRQDNQSDLELTKNAALFCLKECKVNHECMDNCAPKGCEKACEDETETIPKVKCIYDHCITGKNFKSCKEICGDDTSCTCEKSPLCISECQYQQIDCFNNCYGFLYRCVGNPYDVLSGEIPCELCGSSGLCTVDLETADVDLDKGIEVQDSNGSTMRCKPACGWSNICTQKCREYYGENPTEKLLKCQRLCLNLQKGWCSSGYISLDGITPDVEQPCCYSEKCAAQMQAVVYSGDVECYSDTECQSSKYCRKDGVCAEREEATASCNTEPLKKIHPLHFLWIMTILLLAYRRRIHTLKKYPATSTKNTVPRM